jgi:RNA polymerase sigma-70 factor (ECF subfamily)
VSTVSAVELSASPGAQVDALYRAYRKDVYRSLLRDLGNPSDADDGTQAVFLSAFRSLDRGCRPYAARAWLLAIAKNVARKTWRDRGRVEVELDPDAVAASEPPDDARRELVGVLETLPEGQRTALVLHELYGLQYAEISQLTSQSVAGVETSVFRARQAVRTALRDDGALGHDAAAKLLRRFVAGKLTRHERQAVQAHLGQCAECAAEEAGLRSASRRRLLEWLLAAPSAVQRLAAYFQAAPLQGAGAAAVCAVALAGAVGDRGDPAPLRPTAPPVTGHSVRDPLRLPSYEPVAARARPRAASPARPRTVGGRPRPARAPATASSASRTGKTGETSRATAPSAPATAVPERATASAPEPVRPATPSAAHRETKPKVPAVPPPLDPVRPAGDLLEGLAGPPVRKIVETVGPVRDTVRDTVEGVDRAAGVGVGQTVGGVTQTVGGVGQTVGGVSQTVGGVTQTVGGVAGALNAPAPLIPLPQGSPLPLGG